MITDTEYIALGKLLHSATLMEELLYQCIKMSSACEHSDVFIAGMTFRTKTQILLTLADKSHGSDSEYYQELRKFVKTGRNLFDKRNDLMHNSLSSSENAFLRARTYTRRRATGKWTEEKIYVSTQEIHELASNIKKVAFQILEHVFYQEGGSLKQYLQHQPRQQD